jgi:hypothetical protein
MEDDLNFKAALSSLFNNKNLNKKWFWHHRDWPSFIFLVCREKQNSVELEVPLARAVAEVGAVAKADYHTLCELGVMVFRLGLTASLLAGRIAEAPLPQVPHSPRKHWTLNTRTLRPFYVVMEFLIWRDSQWLSSEILLLFSSSPSVYLISGTAYWQNLYLYMCGA